MNYILKNGRVFNNGEITCCDVLLSDGCVKAVSSSLVDPTAQVFDFSNKFIFPGFADVHVHLREPGFLYKETIKSGTKAAARGGYSSVCSMPNLIPPPDSLDNLKLQLDAIEKDACIEVYPFGTITQKQKGESLSEMEEIAPFVCGFSDDGKGIQTKDLMLEAMEKAKLLGKIISAHCEDNSLLNGGYIHDGEYAKRNSHIGIPSESEWGPIKRDIELIKKTGVSYHVCHVSSKESVELIRQAKADGLDITCETAPHYLVLNDSMLLDEGRFKMNPPIRSEMDRLALIEGLKDGTVDMIATDHAPHSSDEKSKGLKGSLMGVVGLETSFAVLYTDLVLNGVITLEKLIELLSLNPKRRFGIKGGLKVGDKADIAVFDLDEKYNVDPGEFLSKGKSTPFSGREVYGRCIMTFCGGKIVWQK